MPYPSKTDRQSILAAAMGQVEQHGVEGLAIRSVASALGLAPNALYRYFGSLADLTAALADESRRRLLAALRQAAGRKGPQAAIRAIAEAYVRFAREQPRLFSLSLKPGTTPEDADETPTHLESWRFTLDHVRRLYDEDSAPQAAVALWAFLHGITALESAGVFGDVKPASSFEFGLKMWIDAAAKVS